MIIAVNYADKSFRRAQKLNSKTAKQWGADKVIEYGPEDIDEIFRRRNQEILSVPRGGGYYLWKPYIYRKAYDVLGEGDYLIYTDSGAVYINKIQYLIDCMEQEKVPIMIFSLEQERIEKGNTKRDAFVLTGCDETRYTDTPQSIGGYFVCKKMPEVEAFLDEVLYYAQDIRIISDRPNVMGLSNYKEFTDHRHDQSVISLISKKYGFKRFRDPSQFGQINHYESEVEHRSTYPQIIDSHRLNAGSLMEVKIRRVKAIRKVTGLINRVRHRLGGTK
ncbi:hypothetical protein IMSAGC011_00757 [Lachnospiraceae bacterium]|nr:hypothetical protein IMSAGC011_00757 [Lachnospiraceae bacterium]